MEMPSHVKAVRNGRRIKFLNTRNHIGSAFNS